MMRYTREVSGGYFSGDAALISFGRLSTWSESYLRKMAPVSLTISSGFRDPMSLGITFYSAGPI